MVAIDANHCPGACMFSFSLYEGTGVTDMKIIFSMLYTGDFRMSPQIQSFVRGSRVSLLHVDDTCYSKPNYSPLPLNEAVDKATKYILKHGTDKKVCFCCGILKKEELYVCLFFCECRWMETLEKLEKTLPGGIYLDSYARVVR